MVKVEVFLKVTPFSKPQPTGIQGPDVADEGYPHPEQPYVPLPFRKEINS